MRDVYLFLMGHCRDRNFSLASISFIFPASILFSRLSKRHESSRSFVGRTLVHVTKTAAIKKREGKKKLWPVVEGPNSPWFRAKNNFDEEDRRVVFFFFSLFFLFVCFRVEGIKQNTHTHNGKKLQVGDAPRLREAETSSESLRVGEYKRPVCWNWFLVWGGGGFSLGGGSNNKWPQRRIWW